MKTGHFLVIVVLGILIVLTDGRRGGGGRGGSRGSSSRGSSSRGSSSRGTASQRGSTIERKTSKSESSDTHKVPVYKAPETNPSATNTRVQPSAPELPRQPGPNYGNAAPPPYPGAKAPAPAGQPPPYPGQGQPPPYPGPSQNRPPPYDFNQPRPDQPGFRPNVLPGNNPGIRPYPQQPNVGNNPYQQSGGGAYRPYPQQTGGGAYQPYPQQSAGSYRPYPVQPSYGAPSYSQYSGIPMGGSSSYTKPYKKQGLLGNLMSMGKSHKSPKYGGAGGFGGGGFYNKGGHGMSRAMYPIVPMMMMKSHKPKMRFPFFMPIFLPSFGGYGFGHHHHYYNYNRYHPYNDINSDQYRGGCRMPLSAGHNSITCNATEMGAKCRAECVEGYHYADNSTVQENECWHVGGVWRPKKNFVACEPICEDKCENGGKCIRPGSCQCDPEYRGDKCQYHILLCDIRKLAKEKSRYISWTCRHVRNETTCNVRCRNPVDVFANDNTKQLQCAITGEWTLNTLPVCKEDGVTTTDSSSETSEVTSEVTADNLPSTIPAQ